MFVEFVGWIPALIFPIATAIQLLSVLRSPRADGISLTTWTLFGLANICLYVFTEKYFALQTLVGLLGTAGLDFAIVACAWMKRPSPGRKIVGKQSSNI